MIFGLLLVITTLCWQWLTEIAYVILITAVVILFIISSKVSKYVECLSLSANLTYWFRYNVMLHGVYWKALFSVPGGYQ